LLLLLTAIISCTPQEDEFTTDPTAILSFSSDTVMFDTVFVSRGTITKRLKVFNPNKNAVRISNITLAGASTSPYHLIINGVESPVVSNLELRGKDSLYILVKLNINPTGTNLPFLVTDSILFDTNGRRQHVKLVAFGQNAIFHTKKSIGTTTWTKDLPHVLLDTLLVPEGATLTIEKGAQVVGAAKRAVLLVNGRLIVNGTPEERVTFSGYRREPEYVVAPGQWEGIRILTKSSGNRISYADIRNTVFGVRIGNPGKEGTLIEGSQIQYAFLDGIVAFTSNVKVVNTLITHFGQYGFGGLGGGNYELLYTTIASYRNILPRETPAMVFADYIPGTEIKEKPLSIRLINSIVFSDGGNSFKDEVLINTTKAPTLEIANNILRTDQYKIIFNNNGNILNKEPVFKDTEKKIYTVDAKSPAIGAAKPIPGITTDLKGNVRSVNTPTIGALEFKE
jgi:hypothetical protein